MDKTTLKVLDKELTFIGDIEDYGSFYLIRNFYKSKEFQLMCPIKHKRLIKEGNYIYLDRSKSMIIDEIETYEDKGQIIAKGRDIKSIIERRITVPPIGSSYDEFNGSAEDVIKHYIYMNCINPENTERKIENLIIADNKNRGSNVKWQSRYKNLSAEIESIAITSQLGWVIYLDVKAKKFIFDVELGINRTAGQDINSRVIFSNDFNNLSKAIHKSSSMSYRNIGYVAGQGEGAEREVIEVKKKEASGIERREIFIDARDIDKSENLRDRGFSKLSEYDYVLNTESTPVDTNFIYERDWNLGDLVTVKNTFGTNDLRITEVREIYERKVTIEIILGNIEGTMLDQINSNIDNLSNETKTIQKIWKPTLDTDGNISWEINNSLDNPIVKNIIGPKGNTGPIGETGSQGIKGENGSPGIQGLIGVNGIQGVKGDIGSQGVIGLTGTKGDKGDQGLKGATGDRGLQGWQGEQGVQGIKGDKGGQGIQGPVGSTQSYIVFHQHFIAMAGQTLFEWNDGYTYPLNVNAIAVYLNGVRLSNRIINQLRGNGIQFKTPLTLGDKVFIEAFQMVVDLQGPKGDIGANGIPGLVGQQGIKGDKGDIGIAGDRGIQGAKGDKGDIGLTGTQGLKGEKGDVGAQGIQGIRGLQGEIGLNGIQGDKGATGQQGLKGDPGTQGLKGDIGVIGLTGPQGFKGDTGAKGANGLQGPKGDTGVQGIAGKDGTQIITSASRPIGQLVGRVWVKLI
ncbi:hypothetical protein H7E67_02175 [Clostridium gasigenes]|uniref:Gp37-like protein n=1 Tax=Clostridium gasigenes TaxID=94869 RepID=UPI0016243C50|nr:hypothetical protein [Clostridium gasigenes]MBB6622228.1 hypothetical protein [Clostridium gasigenes]